MFIWVRGTLPRLRLDQLMGFAWKLMLPMALLNLFVAGVWRFMPRGWALGGVLAILVAGLRICWWDAERCKAEELGKRGRYRYAE